MLNPSGAKLQESHSSCRTMALLAYFQLKTRLAMVQEDDLVISLMFFRKRS